MSPWFHFFFLDSMSYQMEQSIFFYDSIMAIVASISGFVFSLYYMIATSAISSNFIIENSLLESLWTCFPIIIMMAMVIPSLRLLYMLEESSSNEIQVKTIGHQWYWSYEYPQFDISFDSYMINPSINLDSDFRLLDVDNRLIIPSSTPLTIATTSEDVLHCWTIPSWALKIDSIPGKMNQTKLIINKTGVNYGQCSEICGANHSFMPIAVETISLPLFISWLGEKFL